MKIIKNDSVYVQKNDLAFLTQTSLPIPATIFIKVFGSDVTIIDNTNRYEFIKFEDKEEIDFFNSLDFIVDYNMVKDLSDEQIIELGQKVATEKNNIAKVFNSMSEEEKTKNMSMIYDSEKLDFKLYSLRDILWFKQGHIKMILPDDIDYPESYKKTDEKGIKKLFKKIKRKNNK